jgi:hypothetical protein
LAYLFLTSQQSRHPSVTFAGDQEAKTATLFFTLAAQNPAEHLENIQQLMDLLMTKVTACLNFVKEMAVPKTPALSSDECGMATSGAMMI